MKDAKLINFQVRVAEVENPSKTVDLMRFGVPTSVMPAKAYCEVIDVTKFNDTKFQSVTVFFTDTKLIGLSLLSKKGATYLFGSAEDGVTKKATIPITQSLVGFQGEQTVMGDILSLSAIEYTC